MKYYIQLSAWWKQYSHAGYPLQERLKIWWSCFDGGDCVGITLLINAIFFLTVWILCGTEYLFGVLAGT